MKKIMKRNLSVLLAVFMLLGCWVFVAPEKASAAVEQEAYVIDVSVNVEDENNRDDNYYTITYLRPNGSTGTVKKYRAAELTNGATGEADFRVDTFSLEGIPISLHYCCNGYEDSKWYITNVALTSGDTKTLFKGKFGCKTTFYSKKTQGDINFQNLTCSLEDHGYDHEDTYDTAACTPASRPHVEQITPERSLDEDGYIQIPNEAGDVSTTGCTFYVKDQFGVRLGSKYYSVDLRPDDNAQSAYITARSDDAYATSVLEGYSVSVSENARRLQTVYNKNTHTWGGGGGPTFEEPMTLTVTDRKDTSIKRYIYYKLPLTQPEYEVFFAEYGDGTGIVDPESRPGLVYSMPIGVLPDADRAGYTFLGFYTTGGVTKNPNNTSGFGTKITENTIVTGSNENTPYRCGWANAPCTVTVQNNKRQTIATYTGQYGYTLANSDNTGYNYSQLLAAAAYVKDPGETGPYNNLQPVGFPITDGYEYVSSTEQERSEDQIGKDFLNEPLVGNVTVSVRYGQTQASRFTVNFYDNSNTALDQGTSSRTDYTYGQTPTLPGGERNSYTEDNTYTYAFAGWAKQRHDGDNHYFVDAKIVTNPKTHESHMELSQAIPLVSAEDMTVIGDMNYVAVYSRLFKNYSATFHYMKDGDEQLSYTQTDAYHYNGHITPPTTVERETASGKVTDNLTASYIARGYIWNFEGWYTAETGGTEVDFNDLTDLNASLNNVAGKEYWAHYTQGDPTTNQIRFFTMEGAELEKAQVSYSETDNETVPALEQSARTKLQRRNLLNFESGTTRYTFDKWVNILNGEESPYSELPLTPADYYPSYIEEPLHTLYIYNGDRLVYSFTDVPGAELDTSNFGTAITRPSRAADAYSDNYTFKGYSTEDGFLWTAGEELVDLNTFVYPDDDVYLYAHYDAIPINYSVKFLADDQETLIQEQTLHFGDPIVAPELTEAQRTKASDWYYNYTFMGWNLEPADVCTGNAEYYTTFRQGYQYYTVKWLNYDGSPYKTDSYVYNAHMHQPYNTPEPPAYVDPVTGQSDTSKANLFAFWEYVNADGTSVSGEELKFVIGQKLGGASQEDIDSGKYTGPLTPAYWAANNNVITLRARYSAETNFVTVTKYDGIAGDGMPFGQIFDTQKVLYGTTFGELQIEPSPYVPQHNDIQHFSFAGWERILNLDTGATAGLAPTYRFEGDTAIVEAFTAEAHGGADGSKWEKEVSKYPTFAAQGEFSRTCTADGCGYKETTGVIPKLHDTTAPTGKLYVKEYNWESYVETLSDSPLQTSPNGTIILNADDMANNEADTAWNKDDDLDINYNKTGTGSGVATIDFSIVKAADAPDNPATIATWYTVFTDDGESAPNASLMIKHLTAVTDNNGPIFPQLADGDTFVVYARVTDKAAADNAPAGSTVPNVTYLRSDVLIIDTVVPTIKVTSTDDPAEGEGAETRIRHCEDATITIEDDDLAVVTINGETTWQLADQTVTTSDVAGKTQITVGEGEDAPSYPLTDKGLQRAMEDDKYLYRYNTNTTGEGDPVYEVYADEAADKATYTPEPAVGEEPSDDPVEYPLIPLYVYRYNTAEDGQEAVYETVNLPENEGTYTIGDNTYALEPLHTYTYTAPGETREIKDLVGEGLTITKRGQYQVVATDKAGNSSKTNFEIIGSHRLVSYVVDATCTKTGLIAKRCTVCGQTPESLKEVIPALGHNFAHKIIDPTCTVAGKEYDYCERCGVREGEEIEIPATGHDWQTREEAYVLRAATCTTAGVLRYSCKTCGTTKNEAYAALDPRGENYRAALAAGTGEEASAFGHSLYATETNPATCTVDGSVGRECKYCNQYFVLQVLEATGHKASTEKFVILEPATCTATGLRVPYCANCNTLLYEGEFGDTYVEVVPKAPHDFQFVRTVEPTEETDGYDLYQCTNCEETEQRNIVPKVRMCDLIAYNIVPNAGGGFTTAEVYRNRIPAGTQVLAATLNGESGSNPTLAENETFKYNFKGWSSSLEDLAALQAAAVAADENMPKDAESEEASAPDEPADSSVTLPQTKTFPLTVDEDTTLYAVYMPKFVNYTISLYKEDGTTHIRNVGYLHYGNVVAPRAPAKPSDAYGDWDFAGWQKKNPADGEDTTATVNILVTGNYEYKATYQLNGTVRRYKVFWVDGAKVFYETTVDAGEAAVYAGPEIDPIALGRKPTQEEHYYFAGWDKDTSHVTENMYVSAKFEKTLHTISTQTSHLTCTTGEGTHRICTVCGFVVEDHYTRAPLGHDWQTNGTVVYPEVHQDGTFVKGSCPEKCSRCGETRVRELEPVELDVTVKNTEGTPLQGAKVTVYANESNSSKIMSAISGSDGVAHLLVPVAGRYRIVVEYDGKQSSATVDVNDNGQITGGAVPAISTGSGQAAGCPKNCTCHKSGVWPTVYRFIHKFIYFLTRTKCCPDANY